MEWALGLNSPPNAVSHLTCNVLAFVVSQPIFCEPMEIFTSICTLFLSVWFMDDLYETVFKWWEQLAFHLVKAR